MVTKGAPSRGRPSAADLGCARAAEDLTGPRYRLAEGEPAISDGPGLYAIYGDADVWLELGLGSPPDDRPLYVGKAEDSLVTRDLRTHFGAPKRGRQSVTGRSTLRRTFAALLADDLGLSAQPRNPAKPERFANYGLSFDDDERLTTWMRATLLLAVWPTDRARPLGAVEHEVLTAWMPPLNLAGISSPWSSQVTAARSRLAEHARNWVKAP